MRWVTLSVLALVGCGFEGRGGSIFSVEGEVFLSSAAELDDGAELTNAYVSGARGTLGPGTIEPMTWVPGRLLAEIDDRLGPFDGTWASKPARASFVNRGLMAPSWPNQTPPGATGADYVVWMSGQIQLDAGVQRLVVSTAVGSQAFAEILDGATTVARCLPTQVPCPISVNTTGWYTLRIGLRRPPAAVSHAFDLQWAPGLTAPLASVPTTRLRVLAHTEELAGWRIDLFARQRGLDPVTNGTALASAEPHVLRWNPALLGGSQPGSHYRSAAQLRVLEEGSYDLTFDAGLGASARLWLDGEWIGPASRFDATAGNAARELITRQLSPGWHDLVLEGYAENGTMGEIALGFGKTREATPPIAPADVRPMLGLRPMTTFVESLNQVPLQSGAPVTRTATLVGLSPAPTIIAVDVTFRVRPLTWTGLTAALVSPAGVRAPLSLTGINLVDNVETQVHASVPAAQLGGAIEQLGDWTLEVRHATTAGLDPALHVVRLFRVAIQHLGLPKRVPTAHHVASAARYSKMVVFEETKELSSLEAEAIVPEGSSAISSAQVCQDEAGSSCGPPLSPEQLASDRPKAKYVKLTVDFLSDGFASPIVRSLRLRYLGS